MIAAQERACLATLRDRFGFADFRGIQQEVIGSVLDGRSTLAVMPTGAGKSLCYQLPALLLPGVTLVVSPLIALMKDQVDRLVARGLSATFINSTLGEREREERTAAMVRGAFRLVYLAPERFRSARFMSALARTPLTLFAVDEAHCISQWGHDFRPDYARLGEVRTALRAPRTLALTATAPPAVRADICRALRLEAPAVFVSGFDRPNLELEVVRVTQRDQKVQGACALARDGSGIVYTATRKSAERIAAQLGAQGLEVVCYHAGMADGARKAAQDAFMQSRRAVVVATNAFGMGVDKPDIRFVAHAEIPRSIEAYYQEAGRAGRDGQPARAVLFLNHADVILQQRLIASAHPSELLVRDLWQRLCSMGPLWFGTARQLADLVGAREPLVSAALRLLEQAGHLERLGRDRLEAAAPPPAGQLGFGWSGGEVSIEPLSAAPPPRPSRALRLTEPGLAADRLRVDFALVRRREERELALLREMTRYAYAVGCRRRVLLSYFGERAPSRCGRCDGCGAGQLHPPFPARRAASRRRRPGADTRDRSWQMFASGLSVEEVARARGLSAETVFSHLADAIAAGRPVELGRLVAPRRQEQILEAARRAPPLLAAIRRALAPDFLQGEIRVVLAARRAAGSGARLAIEEPRDAGEDEAGDRREQQDHRNRDRAQQ